MQPWSGGRRERSSSVVLLGKLSAIVRRGSVFQAEPEDLRCSNSSYSSNNSEEKESDDDRATQRKDRHARRRSVGAPTMQANMTMWDPKTNGRGTSQRLQFYPARPLVAAALAKPLSQGELMRRATLEAEMKDFDTMHERFAPSSTPQNDQEDKKGIQQVGDMDNNEQENMEEEERRFAHPTEAGNDGKRNGGAFAEDEMLNFDSIHMPSSVRRLMSRIMSESLMSESDVPEDMSNQDDGDEDDDDEDYDEEDVDHIDDVEELELVENSSELDEERSSSEQEETIAQTEQDSSPTKHHFLERRQTRLLSCAAEHAALSAQDQLTSSVRRLVIQLKDDSDQMSKPLAQSHGLRLKSRPAPTRRRAGSCPTAYDLGVPSPVDGSSMPTPPPFSPALAPQEIHPGKKHKKSAFSRIGPRVLETLHLRKKRKTYLFTDEELETIEGARWKIVELAFRFGGKHRSYLVQAINMFFPLLKYGRRGGAHATRLHCNCCGTLQWQHKRGGLSEAVDLAEVLQVLDGRQTAVFRKAQAIETGWSVHYVHSWPMQGVSDVSSSKP
ncbi:uncharacterized protein PITG_21599 [Phytophthora infestans T30-4]|uniref:Uncharacterized protein n=1 Tax=Phytophthora infestans (strain T30-4) TaxID=403677 RepID=D0P413_PHYIT|nr:uncharacterized protein PITG_21599 [Phytophthora infestans T30-4]EEY62535.1 conserved hypothetical protein [Phytophthora infestans T30-4]|eukprot:XP_002894965.1 conserved hypothetical protein [Phytophthora infestans T30-4]